MTPWLAFSCWLCGLWERHVCALDPAEPTLPRCPCRPSVEVWPVLVNIGKTDCCERAYWIRSVANDLTTEDCLLTLLALPDRKEKA